MCGLAHVVQQLAREITVRVPLLPLKADVLVLACATGCIVLQDGACCLGAQRHCRTHLGIQVSSDDDQAARLRSNLMCRHAALHFRHAAQL